MVLTINDFVGFETGGLEESIATTGSPDATESTIVRSGSRSLKMVNGDRFNLSPFSIVADATGDYIFGFAFSKDSNLSNNELIFEFNENGGSAFSCHVHLRTNGKLELKAITTLLDTSSILSNDKWHFVEVYFQHKDFGNWEWFIDGVSEGSGSGADFDQGFTLDTIRINGQAGANLYFDDVYIMSGATAASDRLGPVEVYAYQSGKASATPDTTSNVLDLGDWSKAGHTPLESAGADAEYTDTGAGAVYTDDITDYTGPSGDNRIIGDSNIKAIKGISNMQRSGGGATDHFILLGNTGDGTTPSADLDPTTSFVNYFFLSEAGTIKPLSTEHCAIGFEMTNAQDYQCQEQWAMVLHVPTAPVITALSDADLEYPDQNYFVGPFEI